MSTNTEQEQNMTEITRVKLAAETVVGDPVGTRYPYVYDDNDTALFVVKDNPVRHVGGDPDSSLIGGVNYDSIIIPGGTILRWDGECTDDSGDILLEEESKMRYVRKEDVKPYTHFMPVEAQILAGRESDPALAYIDAGNYSHYIGRVVRYQSDSCFYLLAGRDGDTGHVILIPVGVDAWGETAAHPFTTTLTPTVEPWSKGELETDPLILAPEHAELKADRTLVYAILNQWEVHREQDRRIKELVARENEIREERERLIEKLHEKADENNLCSEFDEVCEELGLPRRERTWSVRTRVTLDVEIDIEVKACTFDEALSRVDSGDSDEWETDQRTLEERISEEIRATWYASQGSYDAREAEVQ